MEVMMKVKRPNGTAYNAFVPYDCIVIKDNTIKVKKKEVEQRYLAKGCQIVDFWVSND